MPPGRRRRQRDERGLSVADPIRAELYLVWKQRSYHGLVSLVDREYLNGVLNNFSRIHGGSFTEGSATGPGLDGSALAAKANSIVAVIQYRLGVVRDTQ